MQQRPSPPENALSAAIEPALKVGAACGEFHPLLLFLACRREDGGRAIIMGA